MRKITAAILMAMVPELAAAQGQIVQRPMPQPASVSCHSIAMTVSQRASQGFQVLGARNSCHAIQVLENAYNALDTGRMHCGHGWAQQLSMLETDLLDALDYAGETCGVQ